MFRFRVSSSLLVADAIVPHDHHSPWQGYTPKVYQLDTPATPPLSQILDVRHEAEDLSPCFMDYPPCGARVPAPTMPYS